jgi:hypothetical protein
MARTFYNPYERDPVSVGSNSTDQPKLITSFDIDLSDIKAATTTRPFFVRGESGATFSLEVKNEDGHYYNFTTKAFQSDIAKLDNKTINTSAYEGAITFPTITDDDQYDIYLWAGANTVHIGYNEVRFDDGTLDINNSTGSSSLLLQKVIYQYTDLTLTLQGYSPAGTVAGTMGTDNIRVARRGSKTKTAFSFITTAGATAAYRILRQPVVDDILSFVSPVIGSAPINLPGENIHPTVNGTDTVNGTVSSGGSAPYTVTMDTAVASTMKVGDRITSTGMVAFYAATVTVVALTGTYTFTMSEDVAIGDGVTLSFSNQMNYSWPINNYVNTLKEGMIVLADTNVTADTSISPYEDSITIFENTEKEQKIIKNQVPALGTLAQKPTIVNGLVTVQAGQVVFDKQQALALAGDTVKISGYGEENVLDIYGYEVILSDLAITLTAPTTTTTEVSAGGSSADIAVTDREGVINNVSRVGGIGINPALQNPLITSGGGADGAGDWTMDAAQTLENGITLTIENTGRIATITGNIEILKAGIANQTINFDIEKLLSTSAP